MSAAHPAPFEYVESDIPEGLTLSEWRGARERDRRLARQASRRHSVRVILAGAVVALVAFACAATPSFAFTFGVGDRADGNPQASRALGARVYRLVIDPEVPLPFYDARIYRFRAAGMEPQLVIGGTGTRHHARSWLIVATAVEAARRWPFAYSVSVVNEPDLSGMSACEYARTYRAAYRALRHAGVRRVLFGEFSPNAPVRWTRAILARCGLRLRVDRFAWHAYDFDAFEGAIYRTREIREWLHDHRDRLGGHTPALHVTEYGVPTRRLCAACSRPLSEGAALAHWRRALRVARRYLTELVAWDVHAPDSSSSWDSSLVEPNGRERPAFGLIRESVTGGRS
jgi:hypothetical protein